MSTRGSLYYICDIIHIYHETLDNRVYISLFNGKISICVPKKIAYKLTGGLGNGD